MLISYCYNSADFYFKIQTRGKDTVFNNWSINIFFIN